MWAVPTRVATRVRKAVRPHSTVRLYSLMPPSIVGTKLFAPRPRTGGLPRPHLTHRLQHGLDRTLTLVSAPAGFGKTTVVAEATGRCGRPTAWLSLDGADSDPSRFLAHVIAALRTVEAGIGESVLTALDAPRLAPPESLVTALVNDLADAGGLVLVLDDYHAIDSTAVDTILGFLVEYLPPHVHVVIVTREDPPLPLARLRAGGQLTELRAEDLRFTLDESARFLDDTMGLELSKDRVAALDARTEGWIAGLQLAALSMQDRDDLDVFIGSFTGSHRFVLDYLTDEVLRKQPEDTRNFLLHTSILDRLCGSLCDTVTGVPAATGQAMLERFERTNLLVVPLDERRAWYRYHHLFADVLRSTLQRERPDAVPELHRRASAWYEDHDLLAQAIEHAFAAGDHARAADLVEIRWRAMDREYRSATWLAWVKALPEHIVRERPLLSAGYAWALLDAGEMEAADRGLGDAERWLAARAGREAAFSLATTGMATADDELRRLPITVANGRAYQAGSAGDAAASAIHARHALGQLPDAATFERGLARLLIGCASWTVGDLGEAREHIAGAVADMWEADNVPFAISFSAYLAHVVVEQGNLEEATSIHHDTLRRARLRDAREPAEVAVLRLGLCEIHHERGEDAAADRQLAQSDEGGGLVTFPAWQRYGPHTRARLKATRGDFDGAIDELVTGERLFYRHPVPDVRPLAAAKARVRIEQGRLAEARAWADERRLTVHDDIAYLREYDHVTLARLLLAEATRDRDPAALDGVTRWLDRLLSAAEAGGRIGSVVDILTLQALAYDALGELGAALGALERALASAAPERWARAFLDAGGPMVRLLTAASDRGIEATYARWLLEEARRRALRDSRWEAPAPSVRGPSPSGEALSDREVEVLTLIAMGLSNREIGDQLFRALDTIKGYTRTIYAKLQVRSRTEAVARARELGLLDA